MAQETTTFFCIENQRLNDGISVQIAQVPICAPQTPWLWRVDKGRTITVIDKEIAILAIGQVFDDAFDPFLGNGIQRACDRINVIYRSKGEFKIAFKLFLAGFENVALERSDFYFGQSFGLCKYQIRYCRSGQNQWQDRQQQKL